MNKPDVTTALAEITSAVVGQFELDELLDQIVKTTMKLLDAEVCSIFLKKEDDPNRIICVAGSGFAERIIGKAEYNLGEGLTGKVSEGNVYKIDNLEHRENLIIKGIWKQKFDNIQWKDGEDRFRNLIALPLKIKDQILGVIRIENKKPETDHFSTEDEQLFEMIANVVALAIENVRIKQQAERTLKQKTQNISDALSKIAGDVVGQFETKELLTPILKTTMSLLNAEVCSIFLKKEDEPNKILCVAGSGFAERIVGKAEYTLGDGLTGKVAEGVPYKIDNREQRKILVEQDIWKRRHDQIQWQGGEDKFRNLIALPLKIKDQILGVIKVENKKPDNEHFSDEDRQLFELIGNVIALAIENSRVHQQAEAQSKAISEALSKIASAVVGQFSMEKLLDQIISTTRETLQAEAGAIFLKDNNEQLTCVAGVGFSQNIKGKTYQLGEGTTGAFAKYGLSYNFKNREELINYKIEGKNVWEGRYDEILWKGKQEKCFHNLLIVSLKIKGDILGVMKIENKRNNNIFSDEDFTVFKTIANVIALTIENARAHQQAETQSKAISEALSKIANTVVGQFSMDKLLDQIISTTRETLQAEAGAIFLKESDERLNCVAGAGFAQNIKGKTYQLGEGITGAFAKYGLSHNFKNREELVAYSIDGKYVRAGRYDDILWEGKQKERFRNLLIVSLKIKEDIFGVMKIENKIGKDAFSEEDFTVFKTIANVIALTIQNAQFYEQTEKWLKSISSRAAHRIGNQLTNYDYIELMLQREAQKETPERHKLLEFSEKIGEYTRSLKRTNTEFKEFGKPIVLKKELKDLNVVIQDEVLTAKNKTNETKQEQGIDIVSEIQIVSQLDDKLPAFKFDNRLAESIKELISNAQRAISETATKKGIITIKTEYLIDSDKAKIIIQDDGPGISNPETLFTPFYSSNPNRTGLGLTTVKQLLQAHGGDIIHVAIDGARFELTLPIERN